MYILIYVDNFIEWDKKYEVVKKFETKKECFKSLKDIKKDIKIGKKFIVYCKKEDI